MEGAGDLSKELDLQIAGAERPTIWRLLGVRFILLPYTLGKVRSATFDYLYRSIFCVRGFEFQYHLHDLLILLLFNKLLQWDDVCLFDGYYSWQCGKHRGFGATG